MATASPAKAIPAKATIAPPAKQPEQPKLFLAVGSKRGLTGTGKGAYDNAATMGAFMALPGATTKGLPLSDYAACAKSRKHPGFTAYAVKYHWLQPVPAEGSTLATGPV